MKRGVVILLSLFVFAQSIGALSVYAAFYANRDHIAKNLCMYRSLENSSCGGQCVLMQRLKDMQAQHQDGLEHPPPISVYVLPQFSLLPLPRIVHANIAAKLPDWQNTTYAFTFQERLFRPPIG